jgi:hypothetical protein
MKLLEEQQHILDQAATHINLQVLALAGSGKTTVSLHVAKHLYQLYQKKTLVLSYNKQLQLGTQDRVEKMGMARFCKAMTIHAAMAHYTNSPGHDDACLEDILRLQLPVQPVLFQVVIIDEAQDLTPTLYTCIHKLLQSSIKRNGSVQIIILGDPLQKINAFRQATSEYLLEPSTYFFNYPFELCRLTVNFRCSFKIVKFVNRLMTDEIFPRLKQHAKYSAWWSSNGHIMQSWWGDGLLPCPQAVQEEHKYADVTETTVYGAKRKREESEQETKKDLDHWINQVENYIQGLEERGFDPCDIPLLVPTPKSVLCKELLRKLGSTRNFCFFEDGNIDPELVKNKHHVKTIHKMKGGAAKCPVVFTPDPYWERRNVKEQKQKAEETEQKQKAEETEAKETLIVNLDPSDLVFLIYVAITRAELELMLVYAGTSFLQGNHEPVQKKKTSWSVHELCKGTLPFYEPLLLSNICTCEEVLMAQPEGSVVPYFFDKQSRYYPGRSTQYGPTKENYAPVIGHAVEFAIANELDLFLPNKKQVFDDVKALSSFGQLTQLKLDLWEAEAKEEVTWDLLLNVGVFKYCSTEHPQLIRQLVGTSHIDRGHLTACRDRGLTIIQCIQGHLGVVEEVLYHQVLEKETSLGLVTGEGDFFLGPTQVVVECKVTQELTDDHCLQALLYSALTAHFGQPCYVMAPNLNKCLRLVPHPGLTALSLLEHAIKRKQGI